jgi:magnesium-transporting ATPase (P-type)
MKKRGVPVTAEPAARGLHPGRPAAPRPTSPLLDWAQSPAEAVLERLGVSENGLSESAAAARLAADGTNELPHPAAAAAWRRLVAQMIHFFALMLWVAAALALVAGMSQLALAIVVVILVNGAFSLVQEYRAERAFGALAALLPDQVVVVREGRRREVPSSMVVRSDILLLTEGARVPADARVVRSDNLGIDLSALTGESEPVERGAEPSPSAFGDPLSATNLVFAGTFVSTGSGVAVVLATGASTRLGEISRLTTTVQRRATPLQKELNRTVIVIAAVAVTVGVVFLGSSLLVGMDPRNSFLFAVGVIVALVPEGLLPTLTLSLAMSARRLAGQKVLVRRLEAIETLGSTTVICTDKTGTLTENQMTAQVVNTGGRLFTVSGTGYEPGGALFVGGRPATDAELEELGPLLLAAGLCGNARVENRAGRWVCAGDPTEGALVVLARKGGIERETAERRRPRVREYPFDSVRRRMSTVHVLPTGDHLVLTKGSPEAVLAASQWITGERARDELGPSEREQVLADVDRLTADGLRVIGLAQRRHTGELPRLAGEAETGLEFLGLVGMHDPVRPDVLAAVKRCRSAGIRVIMITGDHPGTARAVARQSGLADQEIATGDQLPADDAAMARLLDRVTILARIAPEQKLRITESLQASGAVVAMTGDGVNDGPALRRADIGVAMGASGTDVARDAADMVLLDDSFAHLVKAVEEGRAAFDNIRRFLTYHLTDNVAELVPFVVWALSGGRIPLMISVLQVLALDIGTDLLPALALGAEAPEVGVMARSPRSRQARLLDGGVLGRAFAFLGPVEALASMAMLPLGALLFFGWTPGKAFPGSATELAVLSGMVFASIVLLQMANALECRSPRRSLLTREILSNRLLVEAIVVEALILLVFLYLPALAMILGQAPLNAAQWVPVLITPFVLVAAEELRKLVVRRTRAGGSDGSIAC